MVKNVQIIVVLLCTFFFGNAQETEYISIELSASKVEIGEPFSIQVKTNIEGNIQFELPKELEQIGIVSSGMSSSVTYIGGKGTVERYNYKDYQARALSEGTFSIGPAKVTTAQGEVLSEIVKIKVERSLQMLSDDPAKNLDQAVFGLIALSKKEVFIGEPIIAMAKVYSQISILQLEDFTPFKIQGPAEVIPFDASNQVKNNYEDINGNSLLTLRLGKTMIFPDQTGTFEVSPYHLNLLYDHPRSLFPERMRITSNSEVVRVKPLPDNAPDNFIGAVGDLSFHAEFVNPTIAQGAVTPLVLSISGYANFLDLTAPEIPLPVGVTLLGEPEVEKDHQYTLQGMEGTTTFTYYLQFTEAGTIGLNEIGFSYFHPIKEKYIQKKLPNLALNVTEDENFTPIALDQVSSENPAIEVEQKMKPIYTEKKDNAGNFLVLTSLHKLLVWTPISLGLIFTLFVKWNSKRNNHSIKAFNQTSIANQLLKDIQSLKNKNTDNSDKEAWNELHKLFLRYVAFHNQQPLNETGNADIIAFFEAKSISNEDRFQLERFLLEVENIKYGNWNNQGNDLENWISFFEELLNRIDE